MADENMQSADVLIHIDKQGEGVIEFQHNIETHPGRQINSIQRIIKTKDSANRAKVDKLNYCVGCASQVKIVSLKKYPSVDNRDIRVLSN